MPFESFEVRIDDAIAYLTLNQPDKRNALTRQFWGELPTCLEQLEYAGDVRVIVLTATGPVFCAGIDLSVFQTPGTLANQSAVERERLRGLVLRLQNVISAVERCRIPVIAAVTGGCIGAGLDLICACDLRYATEDAFFTVHEVNLGIMADLGTLQRLPKLIPDGIAREMAFTGLPLSGRDAQAHGLVSRLYPSPEELASGVAAVAKEIARRSPLAVAASKEALLFARDHSVADSLVQCATLQAAILDPDQIQESMAASRQRRPPAYPSLLVPSTL